MPLTSEDGRVVAELGDVTTMAVGAVVNAAKSSLMGGGGVDGAIHRAGGPDILAACRRLRRTTHPDGLPPGQAVATTAGNMPADVVIHTVGPVWEGGGRNEDAVLADCYRNSLSVAAELGVSSIAFPSISTGIYGFPRERAASIVWPTVTGEVAHLSASMQIHLVFFSRADLECFWRNRSGGGLDDVGRFGR